MPEAHLYPLLLILAGGVALTVAGVAWRRRQVPEARPLMALALGMAIWTLAYALHWLSDTPALRLFWIQVTYVGVTIVPTALFIFMTTLTGHGAWLRRPGMLPQLMIEPILTILVVFTDPLHGWFAKDWPIEAPGALLSPGPWFWFNVAYSYLLILGGLVLLVRWLPAAARNQRRQAVAVMAAMLLPIVVNVLRLTNILIVPRLDLTPLMLPFSGIILLFARARYELLDRAPLARDRLLELMTDGVVILDLQGRVMDLNAEGLRVAQRAVAEPIGKPARAVFGDWLALLDAVGLRESARTEVIVRDEPRQVFDLQITPLTDRQGRACGRMLVWRDVSERYAIQEDRRKLARAVEQSANAIVITDIKGQIEFVNPAFTRVTGYTLEEVQGQNPRVLKSGEQGPDFYRNLWVTIMSGDTWQGEFHNRRKDGTLYWEASTISPIRRRDGQITHFVAVKEDITARKEAQDALKAANEQLRLQLAQIEELQTILREQAIRDPLTDLYNRRFLSETLPRELLRAEREHYPVSVVMMDIDHFKEFNDTYGHEAGDVVLQALAAHLEALTRQGDVVCRYGGEELLVVLPNVPLGVAAERAESWRAAFAAAPVIYQGQLLHVTFSLGVAAFPQHGDTAEAVFRAADAALYRAKAAGRNCVVVAQAVPE
ncbi:MAG TPA: diguanylate cyclase [Anaerolineaceae bacterium]|nr:diguanylate cyclase [Anaerolineaceae bacterium]